MEKKEEKNLVTRPPVVVILGHVDHGKSSILEAIKDLKITEKESGGITQHIGAYEIEHQDKKITFIDTPGHAAFSSMRSRGAKVADIAVLVVAADDGVKEQTREAIEVIKKAQIPMIVAINKIDKSTADPERVKRELLNEGVQIESFGGKIPVVELSAKTKEGISDLLDIILLVAEMEDLKADISKPAQGVVIESYLDEKRGPTATIILQEGILKKGEIIGTALTVGRARIIEDFQNKPIEKLYPSMPGIIIGFEEPPGVGEKAKVFKSLEEAKRAVRKIPETTPEVVDIQPGQKVLNLILKADVLGSLETIERVIKEIPQDKVVIRILRAEVGTVNDSDVKLAVSSKAKIIGFRVKTTPIAKKLAEREKITIVNFEVIYDLVQAVRNLIQKQITPEKVKKLLGKVEILAIFRTEKNRQILGGKVIEGIVKRGALVDVLQQESGEKKGEGRIVELQRNKKDTQEVSKGEKCGILYEGSAKVEEGDILEVYVIEFKKEEL